MPTSKQTMSSPAERVAELNDRLVSLDWNSTCRSKLCEHSDSKAFCSKQARLQAAAPNHVTELTRMREQVAALRSSYEAELMGAITHVEAQEAQADEVHRHSMPCSPPSHSLQQAAAAASQNRRSQYSTSESQPASRSASVRAALRGRLQSVEQADEPGQRHKVVTDTGFELAATML